MPTDRLSHAFFAVTTSVGLHLVIGGAGLCAIAWTAGHLPAVLSGPLAHIDTTPTAAPAPPPHLPGHSPEPFERPALRETDDARAWAPVSGSGDPISLQELPLYAAAPAHLPRLRHPARAALPVPDAPPETATLISLGGGSLDVGTPGPVAPGTPSAIGTAAVGPSDPGPSLTPATGGASATPAAPDGRGSALLRASPPPRAAATPLPTNAPPDYPDRARRLGLEGTVILALRIAPNGAVERVSVARSSGHAALDEAAIRAIRRWRFRPATELGAAVASEATQPVTFALPR